MRQRLLVLLLFCGSYPARAETASCDAVGEQALSSFLQKQDDAADKLSAAIKAGCDDPQLFLFRGALDRTNNDLHAAIVVFQQGLRSHPHHLSLGLELAITLAFLGRHKEALAQYDLLQQKDPTSAAVLLGKARLLIWMERAQESLAIYRKLLVHEPDNHEAKRGMGAAFLSLLRRKEAEQMYRAVLETKPDDEEARSGLKMLKSVSLAELTLTGGASGAPGTGVSPIAGLRATWKLTPRVQLALGYQLDAPFLFGDVYQSSGYRQRAEAAVVLRIGSRLDLSAGYQLAVLPTTFRHAIATELSIKLPRSVVLLLALRPALDHQINLSLLATLGLQYHFRPDLWIMLQGFRYDDSSQEHASVLVATLHLPIGKRWLLKLGGVYGHYVEGDSYGGFVESYWRVHPRVDLGLFYQYAAGFLLQHTGTLSLRWRY